MKSHYKILGDYIREVNVRNTELKDLDLLGISIQKEFIPSIANTIGTDMSKYKIVKKNQFAYGTVTSRNGDKISIALLQNYDEALISQSYISFEVIDENVLLPEYLMMWFRRTEFDRYARYMSYGSAREVFSWEEMCNVKLPVPTIEKQREIVKEYSTILNRIKLNEKKIEKLEELGQSIYKKWFIDNNYLKSKLSKNITEQLEIKKLGDISEMKYGKIVKKEMFLSKGYPVFSGYGIRGYCDNYMYENSEITVIARGVSGTGKVVMSPPKSFITNLSIVVQGKEDIIDKNYLYYYLKNKNLISIDSGSAQSQITTSDLANVEIKIPYKKVQDEFSNIIDKIMKKIEMKKQEINILEELHLILNSKISYVKE